MIKASIIIPTYNAAGRIGKCIESLKSQKTDMNFEIIVVNDGSTDNTTEETGKYKDVRILTQKNSGPGTARNHGAKEAKGEIILFTDDDCIAEPDWLEKMLEPFKTPEIAGAKGSYLSNQKELIARFVQVEYEEKFDELSKHEYIDFIDTYSAAFRKDVFTEAGGYDSSFTMASVEDQEFSFRLANAGKKMVFIRDAKVSHRHVDTLSGYAKKKFKIGYWKVLLISKNPNKATGDSHTPLTLKLQLFLIPLIIFTAILCPLADVFGFASAMFLMVFMLSTAPLSARALERSFALGLTAPFFISLRAMSLSAGLARGLLAFKAK